MWRTGFFLLRSGGDDAPSIAEATPEIEAIATPLLTSTPTPLALEAQDNIIQDGDDERTTTYPVIGRLHIQPLRTDNFSKIVIIPASAFAFIANTDFCCLLLLE